MNLADSAAHFDLRDLFNLLRVQPGVEEQIPGIYRHGGAAFLHFHDGTAGCYADLRVAGKWMRYPVNSKEERIELLARLKAALPDAKTAGPQPPGHGRVIAHGMKLEPRARPKPRKPDPRVQRSAQRTRSAR